MSNCLHGSFLSICDRMRESFCMAFHMLESGQSSFFCRINLQLAFRWNKLHKGRFFAIMVFSDSLRIDLDGIVADKYGIHSSRFFHRLPRKNKNFPHSRRHLNFCHSSIKQDVFSCRVSRLHDDSFFSIYVLSS
jgi:hypothetical protein